MSRESMSNVLFMIVIITVFSLSVASMFLPYYQDSTGVMVLKDKVTSKNDLDLATFGSTVTFSILMGLLCLLMLIRFGLNKSYEKTSALIFTLAVLVGFVSLGLQIGSDNLACKQVVYKDGFALYLSAVVLIFLTYAMVFYNMNKQTSIMNRLPFIHSI